MQVCHWHWNSQNIFRYTVLILIQKEYKNLIRKRPYTETDLTLLSKVINEANTSGFSKGYIASDSLDTIKDASVYIVTVPTPIDKFNAPDLRPLLDATKMLAQILKKATS